MAAAAIIRFVFLVMAHPLHQMPLWRANYRKRNAESEAAGAGLNVEQVRKKRRLLGRLYLLPYSAGWGRLSL